MSDEHDIERAARELCQEIELLPASEQQTRVSIMAANLYRELSRNPSGESMRGECENCEYETELTEYQDGHPREAHKFCDVCASTFLSKATVYPRQVSDPLLYKSIGHVANMILDEIRKAR